MSTEAKKPREFGIVESPFGTFTINCIGAPTGKYAHQHIHVIEYSAYQAVIDENEKLKAEQESERKVFCTHMNDADTALNRYIAENAKLVERLKKAEEVIHKYADINLWIGSDSEFLEPWDDEEKIGSSIFGGKRARAYLKDQGK